jgi:hypothetical protein
MVLMIAPKMYLPISTLELAEALRRPRARCAFSHSLTDYAQRDYNKAARRCKIHVSTSSTCN